MNPDNSAHPSPVQVLVADDDPLFREGVRTRSTSHGST